MKFLLCVLLLGAVPLTAEDTAGLYEVDPDMENFGSDPFVPPPFVFEFHDFDKAKAKAGASDRAVTFLLMEPGST